MEKEVSKAAFSLCAYEFVKVEMNLDSIDPNSKYSIKIIPSGIFTPDSGIYQLSFTFKAKVDEKEIVNIVCTADYQFNTPMDVNDIPEYFYANSIAIIFPYVRAFVSTVTLQANVIPMLIPTLNLSNLSGELKANTSVKK
mgnify:FL=1